MKTRTEAGPSRKLQRVHRRTQATRNTAQWHAKCRCSRACNANCTAPRNVPSFPRERQTSGWRQSRQLHRSTSFVALRHGFKIAAGALSAGQVSRASLALFASCSFVDARKHPYKQTLLNIHQTSSLIIISLISGSTTVVHDRGPRRRRRWRSRREPSRRCRLGSGRPAAPEYHIKVHFRSFKQHSKPPPFEGCCPHPAPGGGLAIALIGRRYLSNATCRMRPRSFYVLFVVSRSAIMFYILCHF